MAELKKPYKKEHVLNWFFGNFCAKCGRIDLEFEDYGKRCYNKMKEVMQAINKAEIIHKEFVNIIRNSSFCHPSTRKFSECAICKKFGISDKYGYGIGMVGICRGKNNHKDVCKLNFQFGELFSGEFP